MATGINASLNKECNITYYVSLHSCESPLIYFLLKGVLKRHRHHLSMQHLPSQTLCLDVDLRENLHKTSLL